SKPTQTKEEALNQEPQGHHPLSVFRYGEVLGKKLEDQGFDKTYIILGQFLILRKDDDLIIDWLEDTRGSNSKQALLCYSCLKEWCNAFLSK
uniref:Barrier-to-autointegration factor n=1 Tax=Erpetoichthys calabaricus TaxID=27687 RepID=A0A8C4RL30_ERPCA